MKRKPRQVTEKKTPRYSLEELQKLIANKKTQIITTTCRRNAHALGISDTEIIEIVLSITSRDFYKSMTEYEDYKIWQDVYKPRHGDLDLYIKLQKSTDGKGVVIQLKQSEDERW